MLGSNTRNLLSRLIGPAGRSFEISMDFQGYESHPPRFDLCEKDTDMDNLGSPLDQSVGNTKTKFPYLDASSCVQIL